MNRPRRLLRVLAGCGVLVFTFGMGAYTYRFAASHELSSRQADFAVLGNFFVGALVLICGLLFLGVLVAIESQNRQLRQLKSEARIKELQRLLDSIARNIDDVLSGKPHHVLSKSMEESARTERITVSWVLQVLGVLIFDRPNDEVTTARHRATIAAGKEAIFPDLKLIADGFAHLVWCADEYTKIGGSPAVTELYKRRFGWAALVVSEVGIEPAPGVPEFFRFAMWRSILERKDN